MENNDTSNKNVSLNLIAEYGDSGSENEGAGSKQDEHSSCKEFDPAELSEMVVKNNIINACAHGPISRSADIEDVETTRHMIIDNSEEGVVEYEVTEYRDVDSDSDSGSSDSSSDILSVKDIDELFSGDEDSGNVKVQPKVQGELGLDDLPPIEDLAISLPPQETIKIGTVANIVDRLVTVRGLPESPAVDIDSILFLDKGARTLGKVFDVFGPVSEPHYCVRFNSPEHVKERRVEPGMEVFFAPSNKEHTSYVFLSELIKHKGSDASWLNDVEPPSHLIDYSDDEEERRAKKDQKQKKQRDNPEVGETSKPAPRKPEPKRNQRPTESSSRFGSGPSRGRNPFAAGSRRAANCGPKYVNPWAQAGAPGPGGYAGPLPPGFSMPPPNLGMPPPLGGPFQFGSNPAMQSPQMLPPPFGPNLPVFGSGYCAMGAPPQWFNRRQPPPPGT